ncbi:MAG TPA: amino acid racemase [Acidobacteriaceae bacterium]|nr:amino acid racemase [Acidobacteriaceae bacterium]
MSRNPTAHIGIVACSAPGAALCYETICAEGAALLGPHEHPEISLHTFSFSQHVRCIELNDWSGVGKLLLRSAEKLASIGADFVICPDNTAHLGLDSVLGASPIPWLHIVDAVVRAAQKAGYRRVGLLGTKALVESELYPERLHRAGIDCRRPDAAERESVNRIIFEELVYGQVTTPAQKELAQIITRLKHEESCDAVILGCTELPLAVTSEMSVLPTLDSTRLLARLALERACGV